MTTDVNAPEVPDVQRELSDAELEAVAAGKMRSVVEQGPNAAGGYSYRSATWRGLRPGLF